MLYLLNNCSPFLPFLNPWQPLIVFSSSMSLIILDASYKSSHFSICPSVFTDFISHDALHPHCVKWQYFLFLKGSIAFYCMYLTYFLCSSLENTWVVSISWLLWITWQWNWECSYLFKILILIILDTYPEWYCCITMCIWKEIQHN